MSEVLRRIDNLFQVAWKNVINPAISDLVLLTEKNCNTCLCWDRDELLTNVPFSQITCFSPKSPKKWTWNSPLNLCPHYE